jgi:hypothetical protein
MKMRMTELPRDMRRIVPRSSASPTVAWSANANALGMTSAITASVMSDVFSCAALCWNSSSERRAPATMKAIPSLWASVHCAAALRTGLTRGADWGGGSDDIGTHVGDTYLESRPPSRLACTTRIWHFTSRRIA